MIDMLIVFTLFAWAVFVMALWIQNKFLGAIAGMFLITIGLFSYIYGVGDLNNWLTRGYGIIHMGIGLITLIMAGLEMIQDW